MCGIVGYYGQDKNISEILLHGLKSLEYRGYDSSGIAITTENGDIFSEKAVGKLINLENKLNLEKLPDFSKTGIGHTRWATHGQPSELNSHPHTSFDDNIWLVHNGIIENYDELKTELVGKGISFKSQTDTEVVANLIAINYTNNLLDAVLKTLEKLRGTYALAILCKKEPGRMLAVKLGAPLVLGLLEDEYLIASDVSAVISKTREVIYLGDNEIVDLNHGKYKIIDANLQINIEKKSQFIDWTHEQASKEGFEHFLLKEIMEQPKAIVDSIRGRLIADSANVKFGGLIDIQHQLKNIEKVILLGIGTSYYSCKLGEMYFESVSGITAKAEMSPEFRYKDSIIDGKTWVIALSQSGETADTIAAVEEAKLKGALVTGIVNTVGSTVSRITNAGVYNHIGPEISVASSKAFTSQSILLLMHSIYLGRIRNLSYEKSFELIQEIENLPNLISEVLKQSDKILAIAEKYYNVESMIYIGRKFNYPIALEGALKIKEVSYIHAEGLSAGELKHGFIALIEPKIPTIALISQDSVYEKMLSNIEEVKARNGKVIAVANYNDQKLAKIADDVIYVPKTTEELQPLVNNTVLQLFAYHCAVLKDLDVDKPRNLAKSVTVE